MKFKNKQHVFFLLFSLLCTLIFVYPYLIKDFLPLEHDTLYHLSRIEGLATSFKEGNFLPRIYPYKNLGFGYGSPLFYSEFFLALPAIFYNLGLNLVSCYKLIIIVSTFLSCFFMMKLCYVTTQNKYAPFLAGICYLFNNYRITDVYVRGALGEVMGFIFLPLVFLGIYYVLYDDEKRWKYLVIGFSGLACTHNITFVLACILFLCFLFARIPYLIKNRSRLVLIFKSAALVFLLTAFFTLPMLEQLVSQDYYLDYYTATSSLATYALPLHQYFSNTTIFGYGSLDTSKDMSMLLNVGIFSAIFPLLYLIKINRAKPFLLHCLIIGYILMILPLEYMPWNSLFFFSLIQFPWRLLMISSLCLILPASLSLFQLNFKPILIVTLVSFILLFEGIWHVNPVLGRTFGVTSKTTYNQLIDGSLIDPFYSASYMRVELAGGDYLPNTSVNFKDTSAFAIYDSTMVPVSATYSKKGTTLFIKQIAPNQTYILPITYYKGYQVYAVRENGNTEKVDTFKSANALVSFNAEDQTAYVLKYSGTMIQQASLLVSLLTLCYLVFYKLKAFLQK